MKVKICGITNSPDALTAEKLGADAIGFIFYEGSKRFIQPEKAKEISKLLSPFTVKVGVFVNSTAKKINEISKIAGINAVQLHGEESPEFVKEINLPVIKSFRINDTFDYSVLNSYRNCSILLDSFDRNKYGGTGKNFNWQGIPPKIKSIIILSGGISEKNIELVYNKIKPAAVDISSSVEVSPGKKDTIKLEHFFNKLNKLRSR